MAMTHADPMNSSAEAANGDEPKIEDDKGAKPISEPGGFSNDPPDPTNPNEAIERHRRKLRP